MTNDHIHTSSIHIYTLSVVLAALRLNRYGRMQHENTLDVASILYLVYGLPIEKARNKLAIYQ